MPIKDLGIAIDDPQILLDKLKDCLPHIDLLVTTGGVSMGDKDLLRQVFLFRFKCKWEAVLRKNGAYPHMSN